MIPTTPNRSWLRTPMVILLGTILACTNFYLHASYDIFGYDEGDYFRATTQKGFVEHWMDTEDLSVTEFVSLGWKAIHNEQSREQLSRYMRESPSASFLRHHHGPVAFYPAILFQHLPDSVSPEMKLRLPNLFWMIFGVVGLCAIAALSGAQPSPWTLLLPASTSFAMAVVGLNMHTPFAILSVLFLYGWHRYSLDRSNTRLKYCAILALAASLASVEYSMFILAGGALWVLKNLFVLKGTARRNYFMATLKNFLWMILALLIIWPGGVIRLNLLKSYAFQGYMGLYRVSNQPSPFSSVWQMLSEKWNASPLELVLILAILVGIVIQWRQLLRRGSMFIAAVLLLGILYAQRNPALNLSWYLFSLFALGFWFFVPVLTESGDGEPQRWKFLSSPGTALGTSLVAFGISCMVFPVMNTHTQTGPIPTINALIRQYHVRSAVIFKDVSPSVLAYNPELKSRLVYLPQLTAPGAADSMMNWGHTDMLILPASIPVPAQLHVVMKTSDLIVTVPSTE